MGISLKKGQNTSLTKGAPGLVELSIGLGWDVRTTVGKDFDLDATAFMLGVNGKVGQDEHFIFYNNPVSPCGSVEASGDNRTGEGDGADESIKVRIPKIPASVARVAFSASIHEAEDRKQSFGQVSNAFINVLNGQTGEELARFDLTEDFSTETAVIFGELYRHNDEWKFRAVGQGFNGGLEALLTQFGINV